MGVTESNIHVDHIDGNTLNDQRCNLRICTLQENLQNSKVHKDTTTGYKGVYLNKSTNKYQALIQKDGKKYISKSFITAYEAMLAYNERAKELFGEFAWLNIPTFEDQLKCFMRCETKIYPTKIISL